MCWAGSSQRGQIYKQEGGVGDKTSEMLGGEQPQGVRSVTSAVLNLWGVD